MARTVVNVDEMRRRARRRLPRMVFDFVDGGAEDEQSVRDNRAAFSRLALRPRRMVDVSTLDQRVSLLGGDPVRPVVLGPTGLTQLTHGSGERAVARAAARSGSLYCVSTMSNASLEQIREVSDGELWFQLYLWRDTALVDQLVERARRADYRALVVGIDVPAVGTRERDVRNGLTIPPRVKAHTAVDLARHPRWMYQTLRAAGGMNFGNVASARPGRVDTIAKYVNDELTNPAVGWDAIARLRDSWEGPLVLKGLTTAEDATRAREVGVDAVVVSPPGGRPLDGEVSALQALPEVVAAAGSMEVYLDGGVRRGSDVVKAFALGARACFVGRPYLYGLGAQGEAGVDRVVEIFEHEIARTLALVGCPRLADLDTSYVVPVGAPSTTTA